MREFNEHYIITRYGIRNSDPDWYASRLLLFKRYYLPTVAAQTNPDFKVLLLCDKQMPRDSLRHLEAVLPDKRFIVTPVLSRWLDPKEKYITTRLDSDDAIAVDFVERVQKLLIYPGTMLNFVEGYMQDQNFIYHFNHASNMFLSLYDVGKRNCYYTEHASMQLHFPVVSVTGGAMWLHTQHGDTYTTQRGTNKAFTTKPVVLDQKLFPISAVRNMINPEEISL